VIQSKDGEKLNYRMDKYLRETFITIEYKDLENSIQLTKKYLKVFGEIHV
jgi:hypothetical protein